LQFNKGRADLAGDVVERGEAGERLAPGHLPAAIAPGQGWAAGPAGSGSRWPLAVAAAVEQAHAISVNAGSAIDRAIDDLFAFMIDVPDGGLAARA
jgi:hypothetical protein